MSLLVSPSSVLAVLAELVGFVVVVDDDDDDEPAGHSDSLPALCVSGGMKSNTPSTSSNTYDMI